MAATLKVQGIKKMSVLHQHQQTFLDFSLKKRLRVKFLQCDKLQATAFKYFSAHTQKLKQNYCCEYFQSIIFNFMDLYVSCALQLSPFLYWVIYFLAAQFNVDLSGAFAV